MRGPSGAGKSTKAKELGISGTSLSTDDFWMINGEYEFDTNRITEAHQWNQKRARECMRKGISPIIIDNTNIEPWEMKPYVHMAQEYGYQTRLVPVEVKNTAEELAARNKHGVPADAIQKMLDKYNPNISIRDILKSQPPEKTSTTKGWYKLSQVDLKTQLMSLRGQFAQAAQRVYDEWNVIPGEEMDDELGGGGICQDIAEAIAEVVQMNIQNVEPHIVDSQGVGDQHVWVCVCNEEECFDVDIPPSIYERGGGYSWKKIPGVVFSPNCISIYRQKYRPEDF